MGPAVHAFVQGVLKGEEIPMEAAGALLGLIPKEAKSCSIRVSVPSASTMSV